MRRYVKRASQDVCRADLLTYSGHSSFVFPCVLFFCVCCSCYVNKIGSMLAEDAIKAAIKDLQDKGALGKQPEDAQATA